MLATLTTVVPLLAGSAPAGTVQDVAAPAQATAEACNRFALDLYGELAGREGNLFLSPLSIFVALAMTSEGAAENTLAEMDAALHLGGTSPARGVRALTEALQPRQVRDGAGQEVRLVPSFELHVANRLWGAEHVSFRAPFTDLLADAYGAPLERLDFRDTAAARRRINGWIEEQTKERIRDVVPEGMPPAETVLALANAIYFQASWSEPFSRRATSEAAFHVSAERTAQVELMGRSASLPYAETGDAQIVELPYLGADTSMVVVLPRRRDGLAQLEAKLDGERLSAWLGQLRSRRVALHLPKFEVTCSRDLGGPLQALGIRDAFAPRGADFSRMTEADDVSVGAVLHKAFVAVDEAGTEAAAATVVMMVATSEPSGEPAVFRADHPFLFLIRHRKTGCMLFVGRVVDPSAG